MAGNDYRRGLRQVSFVLDVGLHAAAKAHAGALGVSLTALLVDLLEREVGHDAGAGVGSRGGVGADSEGAAHGRSGEGHCGGAAVAGADGRGVTPDWDALLAAGRASRNTSIVVPVSDTVSEPDPLEEIA